MTHFGFRYFGLDLGPFFLFLLSLLQDASFNEFVKVSSCRLYLRFIVLSFFLFKLFII